jgi:hypothetical protein
MRYALLTSKHYDGFALWPSRQTPPNGIGGPYNQSDSIQWADVIEYILDQITELLHGYSLKTCHRRIPCIGMAG